MHRKRFSPRLGVSAVCLFFVLSALAAPEIDIPALKVEVSKIRALGFKREFAFAALTKEELKKVLAEEIDREAAPEEFRFARDHYAKLGLLKADCDLKETYLKLVGDQVGGIYLPKRGSLHYVTDFVGMALPILSHEIGHALQDQHWPIDERDARLKGKIGRAHVCTPVPQ